MPGSTLRLLSLSLIAAVLAATIGLGWLLDRLFYQFSPEQSTSNVEHISVLENVGKELAATLDNMDEPQLLINNWPNDGRYRLSLLNPSDIQFPAELMVQVQSGDALLLTDEDEIGLFFYLPRQQRLLLLKPLFAYPDTHSSSLKLWLTLGFYAALVLFIWLWTYPLVSRLLKLRNAAQLFGKGQLHQRIAVGRVSYVKDLEHEFNVMAQRIENLVSDVRLISSAVSHDLRTPLARMRFGIDTLTEEDDPKLQAHYVNRLSQDVEDMTNLVEILLDYARLDQAMFKLDKQPVDLVALLTDCIRSLQDAGQNVSFEPPNTPTWVLGDAKYLRILINNLLQNALQYGRSQVAVSLSQTGEYWRCSIADDGQGFSNKFEDMVKPFVRGHDTKTQTKGYGMGLAIVKRIVEWHQAELQLGRSQQLGGAQITVILRLAVK
ncbi:MAG: HAMP domain-containing histidine kinase [Paraglaciecola sp.]|nr:HAMP domain-containing histidine kinase [Paraglaciecola sp.]NCT47943.1 HAMP domain-containing histidine kinase [Paraglaciecola sp.]